MKTFKERAESFLEDFKKLQEKYNVRAIPVITTYGPDIQVADLEKKEDTIVELPEDDKSEIKE